MDYLVGFDGGGTKTECCIAGLEGRVLGRATAGASSLMHCGAPEVARHLGEAYQQARERAGVGSADTCRVVCGGFAAAGRESVRVALQSMLQGLLPHVPQIILPDVRIAFEGATAGEPGLVVIAGTGSIAYGRTEAGEEMRAGGWGPDISDEGSGYDIGRRATAAVLEAHDGRRGPTRLRELLLKFWQVADEDGIIERLRRPPGAARRPAFGELLPAVIEAGERGDEAAGAILKQAGRDLAALALHVAHQLPFTEPPLICMAGGVLTHAQRVREEFRGVVERELPGARVEAARMTAAEGALLLARTRLPSMARGSGERP